MMFDLTVSLPPNRPIASLSQQRPSSTSHMSKPPRSVFFANNASPDNPNAQVLPGSPQILPQSQMEDIANRYPVVKTMLDLIDIPSATPQKDPRFNTAVEQNLNRMKDVIESKFRALGVTDITRDPLGSLIIRIPGSPGFEKRQPLMLTAHMDIVAGDPENPTRSIKRVLVQREGRQFIATDGTTTLGSDDKGGIAMILDTVARILGRHPQYKGLAVPHVPLEILFSPDEESSCNSLKQLDTTKFKAKHVLVVDEFDEFTITTGLASAVLIDIDIQGLQGGHSGADIMKPGRINGIMLLSEIAQTLGTGVIAKHPTNKNIPLISKNIGLINGGSAYNAIPEKGKLGIMMRSASQDAQKAELERMKAALKEIERRYQAIQPGISLKMTATEEYPAWDNSNSLLSKIGIPAARLTDANQGVKTGPIHAAAQASILANKSNAYGQKFDAVLIGPHIEEAHTVRERIDWQSLVRSGTWLFQWIRTYTNNPGLLLEATEKGS